MLREHYLNRIASTLILAFPPLLFLSSAGMDVVLSSIAVLFLARSAITREWGWLREMWFIILMLLWGYMMLRGLFAEQPREALRRAAPFVRFFVFAAALAHWVMRDAKTRRRFLISLTASLSFIMADGLLQWCVGKDILGSHILVDAAGHLRLTGPFGQTKPIMGIMLAWLSFPVSLYLLRTPGKLVWGIGFSIAVLVMIALSGERMALLLTLLGWLLALLLLKLNKKTILAALLGGGVLLLVLLILVPSVLHRQVGATLATFEHWQESPYGKILASDIQLATQSPLIGLGASHFRIGCPKLYPGADEAFLKGVCNIHPHNIYLEWLIEEGVIGLFLFLMFAAAVLCQCRMHWADLRTNPLLLGWCIAFLLRLWPIGSTTGFFSNWGAPPFWLALGMLLSYSSLQQKRETHDAGSALTV